MAGGAVAAAGSCTQRTPSHIAFLHNLLPTTRQSERLRNELGHKQAELTNVKKQLDDSQKE
jgi:hypothetical protein